VSAINKKVCAAVLGLAAAAWLWSSAAARRTPTDDLPTKKYLDLSSIKTMIAAAEQEEKKRNVQVSLVVVDEGGNVIFLEKADAAALGSIQFAEKKARFAALYGMPSKDAINFIRDDGVRALLYPDVFPVQGGLPIKVDDRTIGGIAASGAKSEVDEAIAQAGIDGRFKK
jgi:glc operon protein GlcG